MSGAGYAPARVAVVQLAYTPAAHTGSRAALEDPLFESDKTDSLLPEGSTSPPEALGDDLKQLRRRVREAYVAQLVERVRAVLAYCARMAVRVVVFPEYSIPHDALDEIASIAGEMVVVAGTHAVDRAARSSGVYKRLGADREPRMNESVSPILQAGRLIAIVPKLKPATPERDSLKSGEAWNPVQMPPDIPGAMGVLVCLDFLFRESDLYWTLVSPKLGECRFLAIPSSTPRHTLPEFQGRAWEDARRYGRPVLYCNHAEGGGSSIFIDEKPRVAFPESVGVLSAGDEGVIIADIDLGTARPGGSTRYDAPRIVKPIAAASFVYRALSRDATYADWLDDLAKVAALPDEGDALDAIAAHVRCNEGMLRAVGRMGTRSQRLGRLIHDAEDITSIEIAEQLTREIVLPDNVLPFASLRAALSLGAADVVRSFLDRLGAQVHEYAAVEARLRREGQEAERVAADTWTAGGRAALANVAAAVRGDAPAAQDRRPPTLLLTRYAEDVDEHVGDEQAEAQRLFEALDFANARKRFEEILRKSEQFANEEQDDARRTRWTKWAARARLNVAACLINLQEIDAGRAQAEALDASALTPEARSTLATVFAYLGDLGRARALLPADATGLSDEASARLAEARQIVSIRAGEIPKELMDRDTLYYEVAQLLMEREDYAGAADHAEKALERAAEHPLTRATTLPLVIAALHASVYDDPPSAVVIPAARREAVISRIEHAIAGLDEVALPPALRRNVDDAARRFYALIWDHERLRARSPIVVGGGDPSPDDASPMAQAAFLADQLARQGKLEEALSTLPVEDHPWRDRFHRAQLAAVAGAADRAIAETTDLAREFPDRPPLEYLASELFRRNRQPDKALDHARRAFQVLPGRGYRLLLGRALFEAGYAQEAWETLLALDDATTSEVLVLRAQIADSAAPADSPALWERYLKARPDDGLARVRLAQGLFRLHRIDDAADAAWKTLEADGERLDAEAIFLAAALLRGGSEADERTKKAAALLRRRFANDAKAEMLRFQLLATIETASDEEPIDWPLLERAGAVKAATIEETSALIKHGNDRNQALYQLYRSGALPFRSLCALTAVRAATWLARVSRVAGDAPVVLSAPIGLVDLPSQSLRDAWLLVSDLELVLLVKLNVVQQLKTALGDGGRLVIFRETFNQIVSDDAELKARVRPERVDGQRRLAELVAALPKPSGSEPGEDDAEWAKRLGHALIDEGPASDGTPRISAIALVAHLFRDRGILDRAQHDTILKALPSAATPPVLPVPLPERMAITAASLVAFHDAGAVSKLLKAFPGRILATPQAQSWVYSERERLLLEADAAELAQKVHHVTGEGVRDGWIKVEEPPRDLPALPSLKNPTELTKELVEYPLVEALRYRQAMAEHLEWGRLVADFFGVVGLGAPQGIQSFTWDRPSDYFKLSAFHRKMAERDIHLTALIRLLLPTTEADRKLEMLAELGFPDALGTENILRLERRFGGLAGEEPRRILDKMEWMAREPGHIGGDLAHLRIVGVYSQSIWEAFCGATQPIEAPIYGGRSSVFLTDQVQSPTGRLSQTDAEAAATTLLMRLEEIDSKTGASTLEQTISFLGINTTQNWNASLAPTVNNNGRFVLSDESSGARLWAFLSRWAGTDPQRRGAYGRAIREAWAILDELRPEGPSAAEHAPLSMSYDIIRQRAGVVAIEDPELESVAILSPNWKERPLAMISLEMTNPENGRATDFDLEQVLSYGGKILGTSTDIRGDARSLVYAFPVPGLDQPVEARAPIEAILLRTAPDVRGAIAYEWAHHQGPQDGRAYVLLRALAEHPEDKDVVRAYARRSTTALWRLVRDDPSFLLLWPRRRGVAASARVPRLDDLREILSEPGPLPADKSLANILAERVNPSGAWHGRLDARELLGQASEVPGSLPAETIGARLQSDNYSESVALALLHLDQREEHPTARLAGDICFLRLVAIKAPIVILPQGELDLREVLPERLSSLLAGVLTEPKPGTLAAAEGALLRVCVAVVDQLAFRSGKLPPRDRLWLGYRLFQWLCAQLEAIDPETRRIGMQNLAAKAPQPSVGMGDMLDPARFDRARFDHRLAAILYALSAMEEIASSTRSATSPDQEPRRSVSSAGIEAMLVELAERPSAGDDLPSELGWRAVGTTSDLAFLALLRLKPEGFLRLSPASRRRRIEAIPTALESAHEARRNVGRAVATVAMKHADVLTDDERCALEAGLRALTDERLGWLGIACLFGTRAPHLESEVREQLLARSTHEEAPVVAGRFLIALSTIEPARLGVEVETLLDATARQGHANDPGPGMVAIGLSQVALHGAPPARASALHQLTQLANRPPFKDDLSMNELLRRLGIPKHDP